jgi:hypothetical protein
MKPDDIFDKIDTKLDRLDGRLDKIDVTLALQHKELAEHIRRTALLEEQVKPIVDHITFIRVLLKIAAGVAVVAGLFKALS